jgi:signal transduction histidine kinase
MKNLKVLIVDDEPGMRRGACKCLQNFHVRLDEFGQDVGFDTEEIETGRACIEALKHGRHDLVFLDYKLPDISGLDVLGNIRQQNLDLLTIIMTAYASFEVAVSATKNGAFDFLAKPFTPEELQAVVHKAATQLLLQRHARALAEEKKRIRFQFLSVLAHELKAPLNAVQGYLWIMERHISGDRIEDYDQMIKRSLVRIDGMRKLIYDLLDLTRIESGQKTREIRDLNVVDVARHAMETVLPDAQQRKIRVRLDAPDPVPLRGDTGELEIVLNNLLSNGVKYNRDGGELHIRLRREDGHADIRVSDTGVGMSPEQVSRLFQEFVRFKGDPARPVEGSGLGLSILKRLVDLYSGTIRVESQSGQGTTFLLTLKDVVAAREPDVMASLPRPA